MSFAGTYDQKIRLIGSIEKKSDFGDDGSHRFYRVALMANVAAFFADLVSCQGDVEDSPLIIRAQGKEEYR